ncbi:hypothetical protein GXP74_29020 [Streptacidiphilus sp. P02-A3a]|nr:hypothetical protein GXP74_29020 [Streptacidiphilus sp. P02-A3a]
MIGLAAPSSHAASGTTYYVATTGSDANPGTSAGPFQTIQHCANVAVAGDTCLIDSGTYRETVTPPSSGSAGSPITFASAPGATVTVDGTNPVTGWTLDSGQIYKAPVTLAGTGTAPYSSTEYPSDSDLWANQIFSLGSLVPEAAYPPASSNPWAPSSFISSGWTSTRSGSTVTCTTAPCTTVLSGTLTDNSFPALGDLTGATVVMAGSWVANSSTVTSGDLDGTNKTLNLSFPASDGHVEPGGYSTKFYMVGKKAFLTGPNAWYYDAGAQELYYWPPSGNTPVGVTAKARNYGFDLNDRSYITVQGVNLFATSVTTDANSSNDILNGINAQYLSTWQTSQYETSMNYAGVYDANHRDDSGILLHGTDDTLENSTIQYSMGNGVSIDGTGSVVTNNLIANVAYGGTYTAAVAVDVGSSNATISDNTMHSTGRDVVNMNTSVYPNNGYQNIRVDYNNMYDYAKIDFDLGAVYTCCDTAYTGTRIDHNWIHDPAQIGNGFHFDNGSYGMTVDHNVIWNLDGGNGINFGGFTQSGLSLPYLTAQFTNNTIVSGSGEAIEEYYANANQVGNTTMENNILDGAHPAGQTYGYIAGGTPNETDDLVTTESQNGAAPNPLYTNAAAGDFTLQSTSPAVDAGAAVPPLTNGFSGSAPDQGAYESGQTPWVPGCAMTQCTVTRLPQSQLSVESADSQETVSQNDAATNAIDGSPSSMWVTDWSQSPVPQLPHDIQLNLGSTQSVECLYYLPRQDGVTNGTIANYAVYTSTDGSTWGSPVATGTWTTTSAEESACFAPTTAHYIELKALSEVNGNPWTSAAEISVGIVPTAAPTLLPQSQLSVESADSQETVSQNDAATNAIDGNPSSMWVTDWSQSPVPQLPHDIQLNLGSTRTVQCLYYLPRQDGVTNGTIAKYAVYTSTDGSTWGSPVATGTWSTTSSQESACFAPTTAHYIELKALSEVNGNPWTSAAEISVGVTS